MTPETALLAWIVGAGLTVYLCLKGRMVDREREETNRRYWENVCAERRREAERLRERATGV